jgi:hypothetical protein
VSTEAQAERMAAIGKAIRVVLIMEMVSTV